MKTKKFNKKLVLDKVTVTNLNRDSMKHAIAGATDPIYVKPTEMPHYQPYTCYSCPNCPLPCQID